MKVIRFAVTHPVTISMAALAAVVFGLVALGRLDMRLLPEIRYPSLTVQTELPNTAPVDVENLLTRPLEESVGVVPGLRKVHSLSQAGLSQITLEFDWGTDMDYAALDVREKIDLVRLPDEARPPLLLKYDPTLDPVLRIGLWGQAQRVALRNVAEDVLKQEIEALSGVAAAKVSGGLEEEIQVEVDETRLAALGITVDQVNQALAQENINASGGRLRDRNAEYIVRTLSRFQGIEDIGEVTVGVIDGHAIHLRDVGRVQRTHKEQATITHVDGRESVEIAVYKEGDENVVEMARRVRAHLDRVAGELPEGMRLEVLFDQSIFISQAVQEVRDNALLGGALAIIVLFVFLRDLRSTLIIGVAIPLSIVATFILMFTQHVSLNVMSLGGLALGVGLLVDNSIVVLEAIHRRRERAAPEAKLENLVVGGAAEVGGAVTASTLTTVAVFVPIVFVVVGVAGQIFRDQALTVTFALFVSLAVSLTFTPMAVAFGRGRRDERGTAAAAPREVAGGVVRRWWRAWTRYAEGRFWLAKALLLPGLFLTLGLPLLILTAVRLLGAGLRRLLVGILWPLTWTFGRLYPAGERLYASLLVAALRHRVLVMVLVVLLAAGAVVIAPRLGTELIPPLAQGDLAFVVEMPEGTPLSRTNATVVDLAREIRAVPAVERVAADVGVSREGDTTAQRRKENVAEIHVRLREATGPVEAEALEGMRAIVARYPDASVKLRRPSLLSLGAPVEVDIYGHNLQDLQRVADDVAAELAAIRGLRDIKLGMVPGSPEVRVAFDRDKLNRYGLTLAEVSETVRGKVRGEVASQLRDRERHIDIRVMNLDEQRNTVAAVRELIVAERDGIAIPLSAVASMDVARGPAEIHRLGRKRVAIVTADLAGRDLGTVTGEIERRLAALPLPADTSIELGGQNDEMSGSFRSLQMAILLAIFLVYLVMAAQFESFVYPLIIMATVPLALMGAVYGLQWTGTTVSVIAVIGAIMLAGIVVNNGIVLVDRINQLRRSGNALREAVLRAGAERFRPILMTTATTVLGLLPMALGLGEGAELRAPLAITVISGLFTATLLTLVVVPVIYTLLTPESVTVPASASAPAAARAPSLGGSPAMDRSGSYVAD